MARLVLFCLLIFDLIAILAMARSLPAVTAVAAPQLGGFREANAPSLSVRPDGGEWGITGAPESELRHAKHHRPLDNSITGAEVILGGLATAILAAIFAYIRVTRRRCSEEKV